MGAVKAIGGLAAVAGLGLLGWYLYNEHFNKCWYDMDGTCTAVDKKDGKCPSDQNTYYDSENTCLESIGEAPPPPECATAAECVTKYGACHHCEYGKCVDDLECPTCSSDSDCALGLVCKEGVCIRPDQPPPSHICQLTVALAPPQFAQAGDVLRVNTRITNLSGSSGKFKIYDPYNNKSADEVVILPGANATFGWDYIMPNKTLTIKHVGLRDGTSCDFIEHSVVLGSSPPASCMVGDFANPSGWGEKVYDVTSKLNSQGYTGTWELRVQYGSPRAAEKYGPSQPPERGVWDQVAGWFDNTEMTRAVCQKDSNWYWVNYPCALIQTGSPQECTYGGVRCSGNYVQVCEDGQWTNSEYCECGCTSSAGIYYCKDCGTPPTPPPSGDKYCYYVAKSSNKCVETMPCSENWECGFGGVCQVCNPDD